MTVARAHHMRGTTRRYHHVHQIEVIIGHVSCARGTYSAAIPIGLFQGVKNKAAALSAIPDCIPLLISEY